MINTEEHHHEENNHDYLEEWIHWVIQINDTRLYWLWMKFFITAGELAGWTGFSNALPVLNAMKPVTDVLSWSLFGVRFVMQFILVMKWGPQITGVTRMACLSDFLWGTSNFLSAQWLYGNDPRPSMGTLGWWGNMCMETLLVYDVMIVAWQLKYEEHQHNNLILPSNEQQTQWQDRKQFLLKSLIYTTSLACGFLLFRGFSTQIINTIPPWIGAGLCVVSTALFRADEWGRVVAKLQKRQCLSEADTLGFQRLQHGFQRTCVGASVSVGLEILLPFFIWMSSDKNTMLLIIALSLSANALINGCFKRDKISPLARCSLFSSHSSSRVSPVSDETAELSLV